MSSVSEFNPFAPETVECPYPFYAAMRAETPVQGLFRMAKVETELGGVKIPAGSRLVLMYASRNRDDAKFAPAEKFDVCRATSSGVPKRPKGIDLRTCSK